MLKATETTPAISSRRIVEECVALARHTGASTSDIKQFDQRAWPRVLFSHQLRYCSNSTLSEEHSRPARLLDVSPGGIGLWCCEAFTEGTVIHVRLPLLDGKTAWVKGRVVHCQPDAEDYRVGVAFIFDQELS